MGPQPAPRRVRHHRPGLTAPKGPRVHLVQADAAHHTHVQTDGPLSDSVRTFGAEALVTGGVAWTDGGINQRELDKWAEHLVQGMNKSLERTARHCPSRVPVQVEASTTGGVLPGEEAIESGASLSGMLMWLDAQEQQSPGGHADVTEFAAEQQIQDEEPTMLALQPRWHPQRNVLRCHAWRGPRPRASSST